jgi:hypothetical protein
VFVFLKFTNRTKKKKEEKKELVIPLIEKNEWRLTDVIKNKALTDGVCDNGIDEKARESKVVEIAEGSGSSVVNNLEEQAIKEILSKFMSTFFKEFVL